VLDTYRVLESVIDILLLRLGRLRCGYCTHLVPHRRIPTTLLIEFHDLHDGLRVLLLFTLGDTALLEELLPFFRQTGELASGRVEADMRKVHRVVGCTDLRPLRAAEEIG